MATPAPPPRKFKKNSDERLNTAGSNTGVSSYGVSGVGTLNSARDKSPEKQQLSQFVPTSNIKKVIQDQQYSEDVRNDENSPESTIGPEVSISGEMNFDRLLKIDGKFEGKLVTQVRACINYALLVHVVIMNIEI